jgi:ribosomal protein S18 acetylase RimI-like enzyme
MPPNVDVIMVHRDLARVPQETPPDGYRMRPYAPGDVETWVRIQQAAEPYIVPTADDFARSMPGDTAALAARVRFLVDPFGADIGTITAWHGALEDGRAIGQIHWVAIVPEAQGRGLAKPMLGAACALLRQHDHTSAFLESNTRRLPALNLYLRAGFVPYPRDAAERDAWRAVAPLLRYPVEV